MADHLLMTIGSETAWLLLRSHGTEPIMSVYLLSGDDLEMQKHCGRDSTGTLFRYVFDWY